jgi:hypothetical protein
MVSQVEDLTIAGLGEWDLRGLLGHYLRAVRTPLLYLDLPEPDGEPLADGAAYVTAYLDWRSTDPAAADESVARRGVDELDRETTDIASLLATEATRLDDVLATHRHDRRVTTPFGPLRLDDYMRTRSMEAVIHGLDVARAVGSDWVPPTELTADVISLLGEVANGRGTGSELLLVLAGRVDPGQSRALPVLE